jgi:hypothetical protein
MKKCEFFKVLVFVIMAVMTLPLWAQTETDFTVGLTADNTGVVIATYKGSVLQVQVPATIQGMPVREIGKEAFSRGNDEITSVVIPEGVTIIRERAFASCRKLTSVTLPNTLTRIEENAFSRCVALATINLPDSITYVGKEAFKMTVLTSVTWPSKTPVISQEVFSECRRLQSVIIPEGIIEIEEMAFYGTAITSISLPSTIERMSGAGSFYSCTSLTTVNIPDTVTSIRFGSGSFRGCDKLSLASQSALERVGYKN